MTTKLVVPPLETDALWHFIDRAEQGVTTPQEARVLRGGVRVVVDRAQRAEARVRELEAEREQRARMADTTPGTPPTGPAGASGANPPPCHEGNPMTTPDTPLTPADDLRQRIAALVLDDKGRLQPRHIAEPGALLDAAIEAALAVMQPELDRLRAQVAHQGAYITVLGDQLAAMERNRDRLAAALNRPAAVAEKPQHAPTPDTEFQGAELARAQDGSYAWRCNGGQGCDGWVGLGHPTEAAAWQEFSRHVEREHHRAAPAEEPQDDRPQPDR